MLPFGHAVKRLQPYCDLEFQIVGRKKGENQKKLRAYGATQSSRKWASSIRSTPSPRKGGKLAPTGKLSGKRRPARTGSADICAQLLAQAKAFDNLSIPIRIAPVEVVQQTPATV